MSYVADSCLKEPPASDRAPDRPDAPPQPATRRRSRAAGWLFGLAAAIALASGVAYGAWQHYEDARAVMATAQAQRDFVPNVRTARVRANESTLTITQPATTLAFEAANIFARTSGYIETRKVDIGDRVKAGDLLAQITVPELDHQIAQAQATLAQNEATLQQSVASRELARVTNERDGRLVQQGWVTLQQGDTDRLTLDAQRAAVGVAQSILQEERPPRLERRHVCGEASVDIVGVDEVQPAVLSQLFEGPARQLLTEAIQIVE